MAGRCLMDRSPMDCCPIDRVSAPKLPMDRCPKRTQGNLNAGREATSDLAAGKWVANHWVA
eukprot:353093-Chlamydomonas_euryale.AAC.2